MLTVYRSDKSIIDAIANNNESALDYLYKSNIRMVIKLITENNGTEDDAAEILQDTLILLWEKIQKKQRNLSSKISTYLYAVARNKWLQELGRRKKLIAI